MQDTTYYLASYFTSFIITKPGRKVEDTVDTVQATKVDGSWDV